MEPSTIPMTSSIATKETESLVDQKNFPSKIISQPSTSLADRRLYSHGDTTKSDPSSLTAPLIDEQTSASRGHLPESSPSTSGLVTVDARGNGGNLTPISEHGDRLENSNASQAKERDEDNDALKVGDKEEKDSKEGNGETFEAKEAKIIVNDYGEYLHRMEDRMVTVEKKIQTLEGQEGKDTESRSSTKRVPAIPELRYVEWHEFKNKTVKDKNVPAIEVLVGHAKFYYQRREEETQRKKRQTRKNDEPATSAETHSLEHGKEMPERIRINSLPVLSILAEVSSKDPWKEPVVLLRPYKALVRYESELRSCLHDLETRWASAEIGNYSDSLKESTKTSEESGAPKSINAATASDNGAQALNQPEDSPASALVIGGLATTDSADQRDQLDKGASEKDALQINEEPQQLSTQKAVEDLTDSVEALKDLRCLILFIDQEIRPLLNQVEDGSISKFYFRDIWFLFNPGDEVMAPINKNMRVPTSEAKETSQKSLSEPTTQQRDQARTKKQGRTQIIYRVAQVGEGRPILSPETDEDKEKVPKTKVNPFRLRGYYLEYDGTEFGYIYKDFAIQPFDGQKDIVSLDVHPIRFAPNITEMKDRLRKRGRRFCEFTIPKHQWYSGPTFSVDPTGWVIPIPKPPDLENVESYVVIDFKSVAQKYNHWILNVSVAPSEDLIDDWREVQEDYPIKIWKDVDQKELDSSKDDEIYDDDHIDMDKKTDFLAKDPFMVMRSKYSRESPMDGTELSDEDLILLPNRVYGYIFKNRQFTSFDIDHLHDVTPSQEGFENLELPRGHRDMVQALVQTHFREKALYETTPEGVPDPDVIQGKGRGLIILLHGAPGVGKTSTAECVAQSNGKPLFPITCGDLGITAEEVETSLDEKFNLAQRWDCVLLLDEADVFLAERSKTDLRRNTLVSVFLRVLEYYTGILFLTTNRVGAFDEAFKSRIHMSLYYPPLEKKQTISIWKMNLKRIIKRKQGRLEANQQELLEYAEYHFNERIDKRARWNGRQIRNAFQTAAALAEFETHGKDAELRKDPEHKDSNPSVARLRRRHFEVVANAALDFDLYIADATGKDDSTRALMQGERSDRYKTKLRSAVRRESPDDYPPRPTVESPRWTASSKYDALPRSSRHETPTPPYSGGFMTSSTHDLDANSRRRRGQKYEQYEPEGTYPLSTKNRPQGRGYSYPDREPQNNDSDRDDEEDRNLSDSD